MRIGLLTTSFPHHTTDYAGHFVLGCAQALSARGHEVEILAPDTATTPFRTCAPQGPDCSGPELRVRPVRYALQRRRQRLFYGAGVPENLRTHPQRAPGLLTFSAQLYRTAARRSQHWDAIVSHWALPCGWVASQLPRPLPHLAVCHSADLHALRMLGPLGRLLRQQLYDRAQALWFVGAPQHQAFTAGLSKRDDMGPTIHVGPMGIWPAPSIDRSVARRLAKLHPERFTALTLGRLVPIKNLARAIQTVLANEHAELVIAGTGPEAPALRRLAQGSPRIRLVGAVTGIHKQALLHGADALLLPSTVLRDGRSEGVPTVLLEALLARLPIIASPVGGIPSLLHHGHNALLVPPHDGPGWVAALAQLQHNPNAGHHLSARGHALASQHTWQRLGDRLENLLAGLVAPTNGVCGAAQQTPPVPFAPVE